MTTPVWTEPQTRLGGEDITPEIWNLEVVGNIGYLARILEIDDANPVAFAAGSFIIVGGPDDGDTTTAWSQNLVGVPLPDGSLIVGGAPAVTGPPAVPAKVGAQVLPPPSVHQDGSYLTVNAAGYLEWDNTLSPDNILPILVFG